MRIAVDAMGGDHAPAAVVAGAVQAARDLNLEILLCGDRKAIGLELRRQSIRGLAIEVCDAPGIIGMDEAPTEALRRPATSLRAALEAVRSGEAQAAVYAGNTGAGMVLGRNILGCVAGVERPAIAVLIPRLESHTVLLDAGANVDTKPAHLAQFALMGDAYVRAMRGVAAPRIGLLANGTEVGKGDLRVRETAPLLGQLPLNIVGLVEASELCTDRADVVVCDGFAGNIALKSIEGFGRLLGGQLSDSFRTGWRGRLAYLLIRKPMAELRRSVDPSETGGAPLLGLRGTVVKAHGSSDAVAIRNAIRLASQLATREVPRQLAQSMEQFIQASGEDQTATQPTRVRKLWHSLRERWRRPRSGETAEGAVPSVHSEAQDQEEEDV